MKAEIYIEGRIKRDESLKDIIRQYNSFENPTEVLALFRSGGGNKYEGNAMHDYLKAIDASGVPVTTEIPADGKAYSIAAKIFAAGSTRIVPDKPDVLGVHFASVTPTGSYKAEEIEAITVEMFETKKEFINFYAEHLGVDKSTSEALLENETVMSGAEAVDLKFATKLSNEPEITAELNFEKLDNMTEKKKSKGQILVEAMADFVGLNKDEPEVTAELVLQDSTGEEITFPDLESDGVPKIGDAATFGGKAIEDGKTFIMPQLEDATVLFMGGKIESITPKKEEVEIETEADINAEEVQQISVWSMEVINTSFAVGDKVKRKGWEEGTEESVGAGDFLLEDGRRVVTDASGEIVSIKETVEGSDVVVEPDVEANLLAIQAAKDEVTAEMNITIEAQKKEIFELNKKITSPEIKAEIKEEEALKTNKPKTFAQILRG